MIRLFTIFSVLAILLAACSGKSKKKMSGEEEITAQDFVEFFDEVTLPITLTDSILQKKNNDSALISYAVFKQFVPDSIIQQVYGKAEPKIYAYGRFRNKEEETYLLIKTRSAKPTLNAMYVLAFTPQSTFSAGLLLLTDAKKNNEINVVGIDKGYAFTLVDQYKDAGGTNEFSEVYVYNNAGLFMMIMKNGLQKGELKEIINPIDSLPATHKHSGNYGKNERNFITIRDGKTEKDFIFYINFDKGEASNCQAELKGEAVFVTKDSAVYHEKSDPCTIGFKFGANSIRISEQVICGNQRPTGCTFDAYYNRIKEKKKPEPKKDKKKG
jgi:hypothetical protein